MIGCGQNSHRFFRQAQARDDCRFVATCARTESSARARASEYGCESAWTDVDRMLEEVCPDGVVITTPHSAHVGPALAALRRGVGVLCEKPMATSLQDCRDMVEAADGSGATLMCLPLDHTPAFLTALPYLSDEWIGKFTGAEAQLLIPGPPRDNWYYRREVAVGGAGLDCLVYPVSRLISLLGPARRVTAMVNTLIPHRVVGDGKRVESDVDDNFALIMEWPGGQQAIARTVWGTSFTRNDTAIYGRRGTVWITGGRLIIHLPGREAGGEPCDWMGIPDCRSISPSAEVLNESHIDHFVRCLHDGSRPWCDGRLQLHVHEIVFAGYEAARSGATQELLTTFEPWSPRHSDWYDLKSGWV